MTSSHMDINRLSIVDEDGGGVNNTNNSNNNAPPKLKSFTPKPKKKMLNFMLYAARGILKKLRVLKWKIILTSQYTVVMIPN